MITLNIEKELRHQGNLILVNPFQPLKINPDKRSLLPIGENKPVRLARQAQKMFVALLNELQCGGQIVPVSGYRTLEEQQGIYTSSLCENGKAYTQKFVAVPGCSEHQTGLAIDVAERKKDIDFICPDFPETGICGEFRAKAADFGFILRYPQGRSHITQISYEPWHFRFVGFPHSKVMEEKGFTLEEYINYLKEYPWQRRHFHWQYKNQEFTAFFLDTDAYDGLQLPDHLPFQISGNNVDGLVITLGGRLPC